MLAAGKGGAALLRGRKAQPDPTAEFGAAGDPLVPPPTPGPRGTRASRPRRALEALSLQAPARRHLSEGAAGASRLPKPPPNHRAALTVPPSLSSHPFFLSCRAARGAGSPGEPPWAPARPAPRRGRPPPPRPSEPMELLLRGRGRCRRDFGWPRGPSAPLPW